VRELPACSNNGIAREQAWIASSERSLTAPPKVVENCVAGRIGRIVFSAILLPLARYSDARCLWFVRCPYVSLLDIVNTRLGKEGILPVAVAIDAEPQLVKSQACKPCAIDPRRSGTPPLCSTGLEEDDWVMPWQRAQVQFRGMLGSGYVLPAIAG